MSNTNTVNIESDFFKQIKIYCAKNDLKINKYVHDALKMKMEYDNNKNSNNKYNK